ncbi:PEST proteolytic signal-containing nuclear protein-like [Glandiceps talaboti]
MAEGKTAISHRQQEDADPKTDAGDCSLREKRKASPDLELRNDKKLKEGDTHTNKGVSLPTTKTGSGITIKIGSLSKIGLKDFNPESKTTTPGVAPISMKIGIQKPKEQSTQLLKKKKGAVAKAFGDDSDDDEPEEMPPEAKMRMKNIGRNTPTSAGPNSFGKTTQGFSDSRESWDRKMKKMLHDSKK